MQLSPEVRAMAAIDQELASLDEDARHRVLGWVVSKYGPAAASAIDLPVSSRGQSEFGAFVDLFDRASPETETDRALVGAYWFQVVQDLGTFTGRMVNDLLKDAGHGVSNITRALDSLQRQKPALVRQVSKSGKSRQARKTYKLTEAGIRRVQSLIAHEEDSGEARS